ncbi:hypothetical protein HRG_012810 [Hirsutella rhossiliensis]
MPASNILNSTLGIPRARALILAQLRLLPLLFQLAKIQLSARPRVILTPPLNSSHMTLAEKAGLIKKWADNKQKHVRKKRDKNSHVYWYMQRKL